MKSTTDSALAEQAYRDYIAQSVPNDRKLAVSFMFNQYANRFGLPLRLMKDSSDKFAKVCAFALRGLIRDIKAVASGEAFKRANSHARSLAWVAGEIEEAFGTGETR